MKISNITLSNGEDINIISNTGQSVKISCKKGRLVIHDVNTHHHNTNTLNSKIKILRSERIDFKLIDVVTNYFFNLKQMFFISKNSDLFRHIVNVVGSYNYECLNIESRIVKRITTEGSKFHRFGIRLSIDELQIIKNIMKQGNLIDYTQSISWMIWFVYDKMHNQY